ncbi:hypothetical protein SUDANB6_00134 [Streptomyces sp. enrichment culture]
MKMITVSVVVGEARPPPDGGAAGLPWRTHRTAREGELWLIC